MCRNPRVHYFIEPFRNASSKKEHILFSASAQKDPCLRCMSTSTRIQNDCLARIERSLYYFLNRQTLRLRHMVLPELRCIANVDDSEIRLPISDPSSELDP